MSAPMDRLPHWDMTPLFPGIESDAFSAGFDAIVAQTDALLAQFDADEIHGGRAPRAQAEATAILDRLLPAINAHLEAGYTVGAYISSFVSTNSRDAAAQAAMSRYQRNAARVSNLLVRFTAWVGDQEPQTLIAESSVAQEHAFMLQRTYEQARHLMSPAEEALANDLNLSGGQAWSRLHGDVTSQMSVTVPLPSGDTTLPISAVRNLAFDPDRTVRETAWAAELGAWEQNALPLAAAMNGIKGQVGLLSRRRGWSDPLDVALFDNAIDRATLEAMLSASRKAFPDFRRYLQAKARALNLDQLAWYDLFAPLSSNERVWNWSDARAFIETEFGGYSDDLAALAKRAFADQWIDAEPRPGKADGAFCMPLRGAESRVLANFKPVFPGVSTLAHELGHAYHNTQRARRQMLQRTTPMAFAETASIFCETIVRNAGLRQGDASERLAILEASLQGSCQVVVDITSRFQFEQGVFDQRREQDLSIADLNALMLAAQRDTYGDGLDVEQLHPYAWAAKLHYYSASRSFYNWPYMFGLLFALGLYARYEAEPTGFHQRYDELLGDTGMADGATLAARFGIDLRSEEFWADSLAIIRRDIDQFVSLIDQQADSRA